MKCGDEGFPETLPGHRSSLQVLPTTGPLENPSTLFPFKTSPLRFGIPLRSLSWSSQTHSYSCFPEATSESICWSECQASQSCVRGTCRTRKNSNVWVQWPIDRGELTSSTDPAGVRAKVSTHHCLPRDPEDLKDLPVQPRIP